MLSKYIMYISSSICWHMITYAPLLPEDWWFLQQRIVRNPCRNLEPVKQYMKMLTQWLRELSWNPICLINDIFQYSRVQTLASDWYSIHRAIGVTILHSMATAEMLTTMATPLLSLCEWRMRIWRSLTMIAILRMKRRIKGITKVSNRLAPIKTYP